MPLLVILLYAADFYEGASSAGFLRKDWHSGIHNYFRFAQLGV